MDQREESIWNVLRMSVIEVRSFKVFRRKLDTFPNKKKAEKYRVSDNTQWGGERAPIAFPLSEKA